MNKTDLLNPGKHPIRVAQFGTGNFLRAFVDYMIDVANEKGVFDGSVVMVKQVPGGSANDRLHNQGSRYHVVLRGKKDGETYNEVRVVESVLGVVNPYVDYEAYQTLATLDTLRFLVSNTTESGITYDETDSFEEKPARSYPGRLVQFLYERYQHFAGAADKGLIILPVELIENNGKKLKEYVLKLCRLWQLDAAFIAWVESANTFCSTLVDRIVSGKAADLAETYADDSMYVVAEPFGLWVIESERPIESEFTLLKAGMPLVFTDDQRPYRERKVRILNGTHTAMSLISYLCGKDTVAEAMGDELLRRYIDKVLFGELVPQVPLKRSDAEDFAHKVCERFENPFLNHKLLDISLNSVSKWRARDLSTVKETYAKGETPRCLVFSLAALLAFDTIASDDGEQYFGKRDNGESYPIRDDRRVIESVQAKSLDDVRAILGNEALWGEDLNALPGMAELVWDDLKCIREQGGAKAIECLLAK